MEAILEILRAVFDIWRGLAAMLAVAGAATAAVNVLLRESSPTQHKLLFVSVFAVLVVVTLGAVAYFVGKQRRLAKERGAFEDALKRERAAAPGAPPATISVLDVALEEAPAYNFKRKLRVVLQNVGQETVTLRPPRWFAGPGDVPAHGNAFGSYQREVSAGAWQVGPMGHWLEAEHREVTLEPLVVVRVWMGLDHVLTQEDFRRRHEGKRVGTLVLDIVGGPTPEERIRI